MKNTIKLCLVIMLLATMSCNDDDPVTESYITTVDVINPVLGIVTGTATLERNTNGISVNYQTSGLISEHCYTLWFAVWNRPENCGTPGACNPSDLEIADLVEVEFLYAAGLKVDASGEANFSAQLNVDDTTGSENSVFGIPSVGGLQSGNAFKALVYVVIRSHGPAIEGQVDEQIGSYSGGCLDPLAIFPFSEIPDEIGECADIELAVFPPVN